MPAPLFSGHLDHPDLFSIIQESLSIHSRLDFLLWLNGGIQSYLPHDLVISVTGNFSRRDFEIEVFSSELGNTKFDDLSDLNPLLLEIHQHWLKNKSTVFNLRWPRGVPLAKNLIMDDDNSQHARLYRLLGRMRSVLIHGLHNVRMDQVSLYLFFHSEFHTGVDVRPVLKMLLPYFERASQQLDQVRSESGTALKPDTPDAGKIHLTQREIQIMEWVRLGKTNDEIGSILHISPFTVKNHLHRIFKKLNAQNRTQAVTNFQMIELKGQHD